VFDLSWEEERIQRKQHLNKDLKHLYILAINKSFCVCPYLCDSVSLYVLGDVRIARQSQLLAKNAAKYTQ
jgi:hypothetical protein